jgi:hypothetical protein
MAEMYCVSTCYVNEYFESVLYLYVMILSSVHIETVSLDILN